MFLRALVLVWSLCCLVEVSDSRVIAQTKGGDTGHVLVPQDAHILHKRATAEEDVPVIYFPKATKGFRRRKREWENLNINLTENDLGPFPKKIAQIRLVKDGDKEVLYSITGRGANGLFTVDTSSGVLFVNGPLDREERDRYTLVARALTRDTATADGSVEITVNVVDLNDNAPIFIWGTNTAHVAESSGLNAEILQVEATDADQEGTLNSAVRYRIMNQVPMSPSGDMFTIDPVTGSIRLNATGLDRKKTPRFTLEVQAADLEGEGLTTHTTVILTVTEHTQGPFTEPPTTTFPPPHKNRCTCTSTDEAEWLACIGGGRK